MIPGFTNWVSWEGGESPKILMKRFIWGHDVSSL